MSATDADINTGGTRSCGLPAGPCSLRFRVIAYNPETKQDEDCGIIEAKSWEAAWSTVQCRYNYPKRMIPVLADVIEFPSPANVLGEPAADSRKQ